jgi:hypothetical protein
MNALIDRLRSKVQEEGIESPANGGLFELLSVACSQCCTDSNGGNKTCPPGKIIAE